MLNAKVKELLNQQVNIQKAITNTLPHIRRKH